MGQKYSKSTIDLPDGFVGKSTFPSHLRHTERRDIAFRSITLPWLQGSPVIHHAYAQLLAAHISLDPASCLEWLSN